MDEKTVETYSDRVAKFDDGDNGILRIDKWSPLKICMSIKTGDGIGICVINRDENPKMFDATLALHRAIQVEQCKSAN